MQAGIRLVQILYIPFHIALVACAVDSSYCVIFGVICMICGLILGFK